MTAFERLRETLSHLVELLTRARAAPHLADEFAWRMSVQSCITQIHQLAGVAVDDVGVARKVAELLNRVLPPGYHATAVSPRALLTPAELCALLDLASPAGTVLGGVPAPVCELCGRPGCPTYGPTGCRGGGELACDQAGADTGSDTQPAGDAGEKGSDDHGEESGNGSAPPSNGGAA